MTGLMRGVGVILVCLLALALAACGRGAPPPGERAGGANSAAGNANTSAQAQPADLGKLDAEIAQLEAQAEKNPENDAARATLAAAYVRRGDALRAAARPDDALHDYQNALRFNPDNEDAQLRLEQLNQESGAEPRGDDGRPISVPTKKP